MMVERDDRRSLARGLGRGDWLWLAGILILMAGYSYVRARNRIFWGDELASSVLFRQKTFASMMHGWSSGADSGSLLYEITGRAWISIFSQSEISQRAFSAFGIAVSFVLLWLVARRYYSLAVVGFCLPMVYFGNEILRWQFYNGRMYGCFMAATAFVVYAFVRADPKEPLTGRVLALTFVAHLLLTSSHILGVMYSGVFVAGLVVQDLWLRQFRWKLYLCAVASWGVLVFAISNILNDTVGLAKFGYFTATPHWKDFILGFSVFEKRVLYLMLGLGFLALVVTVLYRNRGERAEAPVDRAPIFFVMACFAGILLLSFTVSRFATSIYYNRYLLPVCLGDALFLCECVRRVVVVFPRTAPFRFAGVAAAVVLSAALYRHEFSNAFFLPQRDFTEALLAKAPAGAPLVITDVELFSQMEYYRSNRAMIVVPLDWQVALDPAVGKGGGLGTVFMQRWKNNGIFADRVLPTQEILARFPEFVVVNLPGYNLWFRRYVRDNPRYNVVSLGTFHGDDVWLVKTK